ncbi:MAG TPA: hypothetical protein VMP89_02295 [Solirubrobacteraceae bacterium]|nr:hypothetical protein [Solirubrobacteraceae bacterium]
MRRRMWFALTAVMAASLAVGVGMAFAASPKKGSGKKAAKPTTLNCSVSLTTEPPDGSNSVAQPASQGNMYGPIHCSTKGFGGGVESAPFTVPDSGDTVGTYTAYYKAGTISGAFDWTPETQSDLSGFESQTWQGTVTVTGGTGVYKGIKGKNTTGVENCTSPDSVHMTCTEKIKVIMPPSTTKG